MAVLTMASKRFALALPGVYLQPANEYEDFPSVIYDLAKEQRVTAEDHCTKIVEERRCGVILTKHNCRKEESFEHFYEDIKSPNHNNNISPAPPLPSKKEAKHDDFAKKRLLKKKSLSESDLKSKFKMAADSEIEVYTKVTSANFLDDDRPSDTTFTTYGPEPEQGFYKCHDNLSDVDELDLIPELFSHKKPRKRMDERRNSMDSGRGSSTSTLMQDPETDESKMTRKGEEGSCQDNCLCNSCCSINLSTKVLEAADTNFLTSLQPPPPPLPPKPVKQTPPNLPPKPRSNVEESVRALQSLSNDLLGLIQSSKAASDVTQGRHPSTSVATVARRALDFEDNSPKTPKRHLFRSLRVKKTKTDSFKKKTFSPSIAIGRKRKYLLCSPKVKTDLYRHVLQKPSPTKTPSKKRLKQQEDKENKVQRKSPYYRECEAAAIANNLPVIPFNQTPIGGARTPVAKRDSDDYMVMTPVVGGGQMFTPLRRQSFLKLEDSLSLHPTTNKHCASCTCENHRGTKSPSKSKFARNGYIHMKSQL